MTIYLTVEDVIAIHDREKSCALLDRGKLESAVAQPSMGMANGHLFYESIYLQAGVLLHRICQAHAFEDANKRTAWITTITFLELNGITIRGSVSQDSVVGFMRHVAMGGITQEGVAKWFISVCVPLNER